MIDYVNDAFPFTKQLKEELAD